MAPGSGSIEETVPHEGQSSYLTATDGAVKANRGTVTEQDAINERKDGVLYGLAAYGFWGLMPLYFAAVNRFAGPVEVVAHRITWSVVFLCFLLTALRRWPDVRRCFSSRRILLLLSASTGLIAINWFTVRLWRGQQSSSANEP